MKTYGLDPKHLQFIKDTLTAVFEDNLPEVYLFGSRSTGKHKKHSDIDLGLKSPKNIEADIQRLKDIFEDSDIPYKVDIVDMKNVLPEYKKSINKEKRLLWSKAQKEKASPWRICPMGEHWVRRHTKVSKKGTPGDWDGYCRKNRSGKDILFGDEIDLISELPIFKTPKKRVSNNTLQFKDGNKYNSLIEGWVAYWNEILQPENKLDPNIVKALIASESGFDPSAGASNKLKVGEARGLVQLTDQTRKILKDRNGELKNHYVVLSKKEADEPSKNISAAVRWLHRKRETAQARIKRKPSWTEVVY